MKRYGIGIGILSILISFMFLCISSEVQAETQEGAPQDLASALHLETSTLLDSNANSREKRERDITPLPAVFVPLQEGLHAFLDFPSTPHRTLVPKNSRTEYRAVVGLHFSLN